MSVEIVRPNVVLLKSPKDDAKRWSAKAAKFCTSADEISAILSDDTTDEKVLKNVLNYGHLSVTEFDGWIFGIENVSRTLTHQLVRKRLASYAQESMRYASQGGTYKIIIPKSLEGKTGQVHIPFSLLPERVVELIEHNGGNPIQNAMRVMKIIPLDLSLKDLADISHQWYKRIQDQGIPNEDARFGLLEASKTKIMVAMNSHALLDWFGERTCSCAQWEIRNVAKKMLKKAKLADPVGMESAGPKCHRTQFCTESLNKWKTCQYSTHISEVKHLIRHGAAIKGEG
jgi:thymidylate synthase (FAD)